MAALSIVRRRTLSRLARDGRRERFTPRRIGTDDREASAVKSFSGRRVHADDQAAALVLEENENPALRADLDVADSG